MKRILVLLAFVPSLFGQAQQKIQPDCVLGSISFSGPGNSSFFNNLPISPNTGPPCTNWELSYSATSGTPTISIQIQSAPNNNNLPGSFTTITGATSTATPFGSIRVTNAVVPGYFPFVQVHLTTLSAGTLTATLIGWRDNAASISGGGGGGGGSGCPGTVGTPCVVVGPTSVGSAPASAPVQISDVDSAGNIVLPIFPTLSKAISLSSVTGENQIIAASGSTVIRITNIAIGMTGASTVSITAGTGTNCGTSTVTLWGPYPSNTTAFTEDWNGVLVAPAGDAVCLDFGGTVTAGGGVSYAQN